MAYVVRSKDNPGDVGRAADQQQSVDNESALYAAALGPGPVATGGMVRQFVQKTGIADNVATEFFTITTTNEAGANDGGSYMCMFDGLACHGILPAGVNSSSQAYMNFNRSMGGDTSTGANSVLQVWALSAASSTPATKTIAAITFTVVETSEYVQSVRVQIDCSGAAVTTADICGMVELYYLGFTTPPVITSAG